MRNCPRGCKVGSTVTDVRELNDTVYRRRKCRKCGTRWTTWERVHSLHEYNEVMRAIRELRTAVVFMYQALERFQARSQKLNKKRAKFTPINASPRELVDGKRKAYRDMPSDDGLTDSLLSDTAATR